MKFGLIGIPIRTSLSPKLFSSAYPNHFRDGESGRWCYDLLEEETFEASVRRFEEGGYDAINVTAPYKEPAAAYAHIKAPEVIRIGAANILVRTVNGIEAHNSDYLGLRLLLAGISEGTRTLVVGYGGAAKAAVAAAADSGLDVVICNRTIARDGIRPLSELPTLAAESEVIIYTLAMAVDGIEACKGKTVIEANYKTPALNEIAGRYISGKEWLIAQARTGYELMSGEKPDTELLKHSI